MTNKKPMTSLDSIAAAKAQLTEELRLLDQQEVDLRRQQATDAFDQISVLLKDFGSHFSPKQKNDIASLLGADKPKARSASANKEVLPKYWLPHTGDTWTGRGRPPRAFSIWEGSASYKEWKAKHPNEKFPAFPG